MAIHTVEVLDATEGPIVIPSGSCGQMIAHHIPDLLIEQDPSNIIDREDSTQPVLPVADREVVQLARAKNIPKVLERQVFRDQFDLPEPGQEFVLD